MARGVVYLLLGVLNALLWVGVYLLAVFALTSWRQLGLVLGAVLLVLLAAWVVEHETPPTIDRDDPHPW